jgi:hypothetical protein
MMAESTHVTACAFTMQPHTVHNATTRQNKTDNSTLRNWTAIPIAGLLYVIASNVLLVQPVQDHLPNKEGAVASLSSHQCAGC